MAEREPHRPGDPSYDDDLRAALHDAVSDVHPADRLGEIRRRTRADAGAGRRWWPVVLGVGVATAAVVAGAVVVGQVVGESDDEPDVAAPTVETRARALYYLGDTPTGARLYREFRALPVAPSIIDDVAAALDALTTDAGDPDYRTLWPEGSFGTVDITDDRIVVEISDDVLDRPDEIPLPDAILGVQQAVYTAEAAIGEALPVAFEHDGAPATTVLGVTVDDLVERDRQYDVTAPVNISDPSESDVVGESFTARGSVSDQARGGVAWELLRDETVVAQGRASLADDPEMLGVPAWETGPIDVSVLAPGEYVFVVRVEEPGSSDYDLVFSDTRTITIE